MARRQILTRVRRDGSVRRRMGLGFLKRRDGFVLGLAIIALTQSGACTKFKACVDTRACDEANAGASGDNVDSDNGGGGGAGDGDARDGDAGSENAGAAGDGECVRDSDCVNPDAVNCVVSCRGRAGSAVCAVEGADVDKDGFRSASCEAMPGDDCDDSEKGIHPGATEVCDRVDNDCDGKVDLQDGLSLAGSDLELGGHADAYPQIAWATDQSVYGVSFLERTGTRWLFETIDAKGHVQLTPKSIVASVSGLAVHPDEFAMTWGGDTFGMAFTITPAGGSSLWFVTLANDGTAGQTIPIATVGTDGQTPAIVQPQISRTASGLWSLIYQAGAPASRILTERTFTDPIKLADAGMPLGSTPYPDARQIAVGAHLVTTFDTGNKAAGTVATVMAGMPGAPVTLALSGRQPVLGAGASGFAVAVSGATAADAPQFYAFSDTGVPACGPVRLAAAGSSPASVAVSAQGYVVALLSAAGLTVQEVLADCSLGQRFTIDSSPTISNVFVAGSIAKGDAVVWTAGDSGVHFGAFGPNFCD